MLAWQIDGSWKYNPGCVTEVEINFTALAAGQTRVDFEHRHLERLGQNAAAIRDMVSGKTENLHSVMLQAAQADLSFRLILEIRNRLSDAYQEIMKMQV